MAYKKITLLSLLVLVTACRGDTNKPATIADRTPEGVISSLTVPLDTTGGNWTSAKLEISKDMGFTSFITVEGTILDGKVMFDLSKVKAPAIMELPPESLSNTLPTAQCKNNIQSSATSNISVNGFVRFQVSDGVMSRVASIQDTKTTLGEKQDIQTSETATLTYTETPVRVKGSQSCSMKMGASSMQMNLSLDIQLGKGWNMIRTSSNTVLDHKGDHIPTGYIMTASLKDSIELGSTKLGLMK